MAKKSKIARNEQRKELVARHQEKRAALKAIIADPATSAEDRLAAVQKLAALSPNGSPTRLRNRDAVDGRPRAYLSKFGISRVRFRSMAHRGELPGVTKASW